MTLLVKATDAHFAWFLGEGPQPDALRQPENGVDDPTVLRVLRGLVAELEQAGRGEHWLIADGGEVVGLCGLVRPPGADGVGEIGFGVAPARRGKRFASRAVRQLVEALQGSGQVTAVRAQTALDNLASQAVLVRNGFVRCGERDDPEKGVLIQWSREL